MNKHKKKEKDKLGKEMKLNKTINKRKRMKMLSEQVSISDIYIQDSIKF